MSLLILLLVALAGLRLTNLWLAEEIARRPREWALRRGGRLAYLAGCPNCLSVWFAALALALWTWGGIAGQLLVTLFAASAVALLVNHVQNVLGGYTLTLARGLERTPAMETPPPPAAVPQLAPVPSPVLPLARSADEIVKQILGNQIAEMAILTARVEQLLVENAQLKQLLVKNAQLPQGSGEPALAIATGRDGPGVRAV